MDNYHFSSTHAHRTMTFERHQQVRARCVNERRPKRKKKKKQMYVHVHALNVIGTQDCAAEKR